MFCWGKSSEGQLGLGEIADEPVLSPRIVEDTFGTVSEIKDIVCGWEHSAVLKQDGVVYTCGSNENGQLGHHKDGRKLGEPSVYVRSYCLFTAVILINRGVCILWQSKGGKDDNVIKYFTINAAIYYYNNNNVI